MRRLVLTMLAAGFAAAPACAADGWRFNLMPYVWGAGMDGTVRHEKLPGSIGVEADFGDVLDNLDVGGMLAFEGHKGRAGFLLDAMYVKLSTDATVPQIGLPVSLGSKTFTGMAAGQYRLVEDSIGSIDLLAGVRYWSVEARIAYNVPSAVPLPPPLPHSYDASETGRWADAMLGAKMNVHLTRRLSLNAHGMVGGGGSRLASDAMLGLGVALGKSSSLLIGYRHITADYQRGGFEFDANVHGPAVGLGLRF